MAYLIHGHICHIQEAKIKRLIWIYETIMFIFVYDTFLHWRWSELHYITT